MLVQTESEGQLPRVSRPVPILLRVLPQLSADEPRQWSVSTGLEIGRDVDPHHGIRLPDDGKLSKRHAVVEVRGESLLLRDLGSKNHTYVNGKQVATTSLRDGDIIRTGGTLFVLRYKRVPEQDAPQDAIEIRSRLLGYSAAIRKLRHELSQVSRSSAPVLLLAPTGAGKELAAEAIHGQSGRKRDALVRVNCASIASSLSESELFGHERDAFSGARRTHQGFFGQADRGTLFLDEVGDMPAELQPKLLRVLQPVQAVPANPEAGQTPYVVRIRPVGSEREVELDVRIVAATHVDMARSVEQGRFRADLYQRLQALPVRLPTLLERREDILWLFHHYLNLGRAESDWRTVSARLGELLLLYSWPGNVRELIAAVQRLLVCAPVGRVLDLDVLPKESLESFQAPVKEPQFATEEEEEDAVTPQLITRELLERLVAENQGNISRIARAVARSPRQIRRRLQEFGLYSKVADDGLSLGRQSDTRKQHLEENDDEECG